MMELLMGNEAIAAGALAAGVRVVAGYPGTPSTEVLETIAKRNPGFVYVEWSVNEKAALEVAAGAAYSGARTLVTMKQVGLNVASDPLMSLNYVGVKGGMVVFVADDPGPISSQTEQDTRHYGKFAKIPVFDPSSPEEAYEMIQDAFALSEELSSPVLFRATTRVCHGCASVDIRIPEEGIPVSGFEKDPHFVIFPKLSYESKKMLERREIELSSRFSESRWNAILEGETGAESVGIVCGGVSAAYTEEALEGIEERFRVFRVGTPFPFPEEAAARFLKGLERVLVFEELDPVLEDALVRLCGKMNKRVEILGKRSGTVPCAGELSAAVIRGILADTCGVPPWPAPMTDEKAPTTPVRPPVLCAGCPHRASFYAVKRAMKARKAVFCRDIGCYTLGNAAPLNMVDTCLCMGAGLTVAQGIGRTDPDCVAFGFVGDSTFFASGMTGVVNAVYNRSNLIVVVLDNSTTAMTGHQPHPGIGRTVMGDAAPVVSIPAILKAAGVSFVREVDPLDLDAAVAAVEQAAEETGVRAIVFRSPCIAKVKKSKVCRVEAENCTGCKKCIRELGCPALFFNGKTVEIDPHLCTGCGLCGKICPVQCIKEAVVK